MNPPHMNPPPPIATPSSSIAPFPTTLQGQKYAALSVQFRHTTTNDNAEQLCEFIWRNTEEPQFVVEFASLGACEDVAQALFTFQQANVNVANHACRAIYGLMRGNNIHNRSKFWDLDIVPCIMKMLHPWGTMHSDCAEAVCKALLSLSLEHQVEILQHGAASGVGHLLRTWGKSHKGVAQYGCAAINNFSTCHAPQVGKILLEVDACDHVADIVRTWRTQSKEVMETACVAIVTLTTGVERKELCDRFRTLGTCEELVKVLVTWNIVPKIAAIVLSALAHFVLVPECRVCLINDGLFINSVNMTLHMWSKQDRTIALQGSRVIANLLDSCEHEEQLLDRYGSLGIEIVSIAKRWGLVDLDVATQVFRALNDLAYDNNFTILQVLNQDDIFSAALNTWGRCSDSIAFYVCDTIGVICDDSFEVQHRLANAGTPDAVIHILRAWVHQSSNNVVTAACSAIAGLARGETDDAALDLGQRLGACDLIVETLQVWGKSDENVTKRACRAMAALAESSDNRRKLQHGCHFIVAALQTWGNTNEIIAHWSTVCVIQLAMYEPNRRILTEEEGACEVIVALLRQRGLVMEDFAWNGLGAILALAGGARALGKVGACELVTDMLARWGMISHFAKRGCDVLLRLILYDERNKRQCILAGTRTVLMDYVLDCDEKLLLMSKLSC